MRTARETFEGELTVAYDKLRIEEVMTSRVTVDPEALTVTARSNQGPVKHLESEWRIVPTGENRCDITFTVDYQLKSRTLQFVLLRHVRPRGAQGHVRLRGARPRALRARDLVGQLHGRPHRLHPHRVPPDVAQPQHPRDRSDAPSAPPRNGRAPRASAPCRRRAPQRPSPPPRYPPHCARAPLPPWPAPPPRSPRHARAMSSAGTPIIRVLASFE